MRRIAIFCDGTWNSPAKDTTSKTAHIKTAHIKTHVERLSLVVEEKTANQKSIYIPGVGAAVNKSGFLEKFLDKAGGGAFGWGLDDNIRQAYLELAEEYKIGDEIHIFGFSRGAYTARSLAGMIRKCGILPNPTPETVARAFEVYRMPGVENHPDSLKILAARRQLSPHVATSQNDMNWRLVNPPIGRVENSHLITIRYLGIWDTVGALGIPISLLGGIAALWNRRYSFHDTSLSSMVKSARHAIALDERRVFFRPSLWDNLEKTPDGPGLNEDDRTAARPYQQVWFVGTHAIVGGSGKTRGLANITLDWVAKGAEEAKLILKTSPPLLDAVPDALVESDELYNPKWIYRVAATLLAWRKGPGHPIDLHPSAQARVDQRPEYRPKSLKALLPHLFGKDPIPSPAPREAASGRCL